MLIKKKKRKLTVEIIPEVKAFAAQSDELNLISKTR